MENEIKKLKTDNNPIEINEGYYTSKMFFEKYTIIDTKGATLGQNSGFKVLRDMGYLDHLAVNGKNVNIILDKPSHKYFTMVYSRGKNTNMKFPQVVIRRSKANVLAKLIKGKMMDD